jgi:ligand-binding sensor domain-containing protein
MYKTQVTLLTLGLLLWAGLSLPAQALQWQQMVGTPWPAAQANAGTTQCIATPGGLAELDCTTLELTLSNSSNSELPFNNCTDVATCTNGDVWVALRECGIALRHDGQWSHYLSTNSPLPHDIVTDIITHNDTLWAATWNGIARFDGQQWKLYQTVDLANYATSILLDATAIGFALDKLWIGVFGIGLCSYDGQQWYLYRPENSGLNDVMINALATAPDGSLWIGTDLGLVQFDGTNWLDVSDQLPHPQITALHCTASGDIWAGTGMGAACCINGQWNTISTASAPLAADHILTIASDEQNRIWLGTTGGMHLYNGTNWTDISLVNSGLSNNWIIASLAAADGAQWFSCLTHGLCYVQDGIWTQLNSPSGYLPDDTVTDMLQASDGTLWCTTFDSGLASFDGSDWQIFDTYHCAIASDDLMCLTRTSDGALWIGSRNAGLISFDGTNWDIYTSATSPLPHDYIRSLCHDEQNRIWIGTESGLACLDGDEWSTYTQANSPIPGDIIKALSCHQGALWIGTNNGLACLLNDQWTVYNTTNSPLLTNKINALFSDNADRLWIGCYNGGLFLLEDGQWTAYTSYQYLPSADVRTIHQDASGDLWIGTTAGLVRRHEANALAASSHPAPPHGQLMCYPNPSRAAKSQRGSATTIVFSAEIASGENANLQIFNIKGQTIRTLQLTDEAVKGRSIIWDGCNEQGAPVRSGVYLCRLTTPHQSLTTKITLLK